jgi:hypothetical protein
MLKPLIISLTLSVALCACSKQDDAVSSNRTTPPAVGSSSDAPRNGADVTTQAPVRSQAETKATAKAPATQTEASPKKHSANAAHESAKRTRSVMSQRWKEFQAQVDRCDTTTGSATEQCLNEAKDVYRSAHFKCDALAAPERAYCLQFAERWNNAVADAPRAAVKHDRNPTTMPASPGDPRPAERNRDSTKQQQDAVGTIPDATKPN